MQLPDCEHGRVYFREFGAEIVKSFRNQLTFLVCIHEFGSLFRFQHLFRSEISYVILLRYMVRYLIFIPLAQFEECVSHQTCLKTGLA